MPGVNDSMLAGGSPSGESASVFGVVRFFNESGLLQEVSCPTEADYWRELNAGVAWVDSEPNRPLDVHGVRYASPAQFPDGGAA